MQRYTEHLVPAHEFSRPSLLGAIIVLMWAASNTSLVLDFVSAFTLTLNLSCQVFHSHTKCSFRLDFPSGRHKRADKALELTHGAGIVRVGVGPVEPWFGFPEVHLPTTA